MFKWLTNLLTGPDMQKSAYTTRSKGVAPPTAILGKFRYDNHISCPKTRKTYIVEVTVGDSETSPYGHCGCGRKLMLYSAPMRKSRTFGDKTYTTESGRMTRIDVGDGHSIRLGDVHHYEVFK